MTESSAFWQSSGPEITHAFVQTMERMRQEYATALELISEMESRGLHSEAGYGSLRQFISHLGRLHPREAARMFRHAEDTRRRSGRPRRRGCWIAITSR